MTDINLKAIVIGSVVVLISYYLLGLPLTGCFIFLMLNLVAFLGKKHMKKLKDIDKTLSSYQYLRSFDEWIKHGIEANTNINENTIPVVCTMCY